MAVAPEDIMCLVCGRLMFVSSKHLDLDWDEKPDRVMFFYDCPLNHAPRRAFYNTGEEFKSKPNLCPKCNSPMERTSERIEKEKKIISTETCTNCGHVITEEMSLTSAKKKEEKLDPNFVKDRERFCSDAEGEKYVKWMETAHELTEYLEKQKEKEQQKDLYDKVAKLKKLKIIEIEQLLAPILEKSQYIKFHFKDPEVSRDVHVPFVVHDAKGDRNERVSKYDLEKLIKKTLKDTNWRLMTEGINYRLGMLEGRLRAYEREDDLIKLIN